MYSFRKTLFLGVNNNILYIIIILIIIGPAVLWLKHYATSRKFAVSIPDEFSGFFSLPILPAALWPWGRLSLLTEMSTMNVAGDKGRPAREVVLTAICEPIV
jgi:hypothetical protein